MKKPYLFALGAILLWSTLAVLGLRLADMPPFLLVGCGLIVGGLCGLPWAREWRVSVKTLALGVYGLFGYHFCLFMAFRMAPSVEVNLLNYLWPLLIVLLSPWMIPGFKLKRLHIFAAFLGFTGALLIATGGKLNISPDYFGGYLLALAAAFIWSSYSLLLKRLPQVTTATMGLFCLVSGLLSLVCHVLFENSYEFAQSDLPTLLILGVGPMGAAFFLWDRALKGGDPRVVGSLSYLTPLLSTLLLVLSGKGEFTWISLASLVLILSGAVLGTLASAKDKNT